jgi:hypothetical protein
MQINANLLIDELLACTDRSTLAVKKLKELSAAQLNYKKNAEAWSVLECIEHLNLYGDYYLPEMEQQILANKHMHAKQVFKAGLLGNYFANLMKATNGKMKKMKSPADKNPANSALTITTIDRFLKQQELLRSLLVQARAVDIGKIETPLSISKLVKLKLGDTFRFVVYHIERHVAQAGRVNAL